MKPESMTRLFTQFSLALGLSLVACAAGAQGRPLAFEAEMKEGGMFTSFNNRIVKPAGNGPFPAVVLLPSCAGVNDALLDRAKELLAAGYAVLTVDPYTPRSMTPWQVCGPMFPTVMKDAQDALKHLHKFDAINKQRIFAAGWSTGAAGAIFATSPESAKDGGPDVRFTASVAHYANCIYQESPGSPRAVMLRDDINRPLLMLIAETDVPVSNCFPLVDEMKSAGKPVEWHVFKGAAHLWDRPDETRGSRVNGFGQTITFRYSRDVTKEATQRTIDFFNRFK